jgi:amino acid permease
VKRKFYPKMESREDVEATLLGNEDDLTNETPQEDDENSHFTGQVRLNHSTSALAATIIGAGIVALPKAFATLGLVLGIGLLAVVWSLAYFSLAALIRAATAAKCWTYDSLAKSIFGKLGSSSLDVAILANNSGSMIIYLIIMGDVLVGAPPHYSGLITNLFGIHSGDVVWVSRPFVVRCIDAYEHGGGM